MARSGGGDLGTGAETGAVDDLGSGGRTRTVALPAMSLGLAVIAAVITSQAAVDLEWLVIRLEVAAVALLVFGIGLRSERIVAFAAAPALIGLVVGATGSTEIAWGRALIVGCLWFLATEAALSAIEWSGRLQVSASVAQRRLLDVATVVLVGAGVGVVGLGVASWAPERSIAARIVVLAGVLGALLIGVRHLAAVGDDVAPPSDDGEASTGRDAGVGGQRVADRDR